MPDRTLFIADRLNPLSPTSEVVSRARLLQTNGQEANTFDLQSQFRHARFCARSIRNLLATINDFDPTHIECWGPRSIETSTLARALRPGLMPFRRLSSAIHWTAVHTSTVRLLDQHQGLFPGSRYATFDQHLIRSQHSLIGVRESYPTWNVDVLPLASPSTENGSAVDASRLRQRLNLPANARLIGTVADLVPRTRIKDFIWAGDLMRCIRDDVYWLVIGDGPQRKRLQRFANHLEIGDRLRFVNWHAEENNAEEIVSSLDVYVQSSSYEEGCRGMLHAMSNGVPVVATTEPLHRQLVQHGINGFVVECGARNEIARCVNRLINRPDIAARFSKQTACLRLAS